MTNTGTAGDPLHWSQFSVLSIEDDKEAESKVHKNSKGTKIEKSQDSKVSQWGAAVEAGQKHRNIEDDETGGKHIKYYENKRGKE
jgi:hypothetical protein